jgi:membrane protein
VDLLVPVRAFDRFQQRRRMLAFLVAVLKKFSDDRAASLAALIAYYGYFSLFPLLLVFVTVLGFVLEGDPQAQQQILSSTLAKLPVIGPQLQVHSLQGSAIALVVGVVGSLLAGIAVTEETQNAFSQVWAVPKKMRPNYLYRRLRGLGMLAVLGVLNIISAIATELASTEGGGTVTIVLELAASLAVNLALFYAAFRLLTPDDIETRDLLIGIVVSAVVWTILLAVGSYLVTRVLTRQSNTYGVFALVIGLLSWLYLAAQTTLYAAEINVVYARGLWPRSLLEVSEPADRKTLRSLAKIEERVDEESVDVSFKDKEPKRSSDDQDS